MDDDGAAPTGWMRKRKVDPASGRWRVVAEWRVAHLGDDRHGTWLGSHRGNTVRVVDGTAVPQSRDHVWLLPPGSPWVVCFWAEDQTVLTVDVALPPTRDGDAWTFDDLELDLWLNSLEGAGVVDQDELDAVAHLLPPEVVELAVRTADELLPLLERRAEPFGTASERWMEALLALPRPGEGR